MTQENHAVQKNGGPGGTGPVPRTDPIWAYLISALPTGNWSLPPMPAATPDAEA
jgi:hypothetical protein